MESWGKEKVKKVTIVIPCYFNELNLWKTYQVLKNDVLDKRVDINFEIICVDDGSKDRTLDILLEIQKVEKRLKVIKFSKNFGEFRAILAGLEKATGDCIAVMSADLQDPPHLITEMIKAWENGHKVVIAARSGRNEPWLKKQLDRKSVV